MLMRVVPCMALAAVLSWPVPATDRIVGNSGSGAPYTTIQAAVDASQPGDRVIVFPGQYTGAVTVNDKGIEIIGSGVAVTLSQSIATFSPGQIPPALVITNLGAGKRLRVTGIRFGTLGQMLVPLAYVAAVHNCAGIVELCDVDLLGAQMPPYYPGAFTGMLRIQNCAQVVASRVRALGSTTTFPIPSIGGASQLDGLSGFAIDNATVWMMDCEADGNATKYGFSGIGGDGGAGIRAMNAMLHVGRSTIRGGQSAGRQPGVAGLGGPGISAIGTSILVHGGAGNLIAGANAYESSALGPLALGQAGSAVTLDAQSWLAYGSDVVLTAGSGTASLPAALPIDAPPGATVIAAPYRLPTVSITPAYAALGSTLTVTITGEPGIEQIRAVTLQTAPWVAFPGATGLLVVDLPSVLFFHVEPIGPTGSEQFLVPVPNDPSLGGLQIVEQGAQGLPAGISISPPILATLGF